MRNQILVTLLFVVLNACSTKNADINIDSSRIVYKMTGGIGASWHAISEDTIDESPEYKLALCYKNNRVRAWGGNPPVTNKDAWEQIYRHASWLGMSFVRVELSASKTIALELPAMSINTLTSIKSTHEDPAP